MAKLVGKTIWVDGRYFEVLRVDEFLEVLFVIEIDRQFKTAIAFEEIF